MAYDRSVAVLLLLFGWTLLVCGTRVQIVQSIVSACLLAHSSQAGQHKQTVPETGPDWSKQVIDTRGFCPSCECSDTKCCHRAWHAQTIITGAKDKSGALEILRGFVRVAIVVTELRGRTANDKWPRAQQYHSSRVHARPATTMMM